MHDMPDFASSYGSRSMAIVRLTGFFLLILGLTPVQFVYRALKPGDAFRIPQLFHRSLMRLLGFQIRVHGAIAETKPILFVANHASYLDIPVLSSLLPAAFAAKSEVAGWPLIGFLARMQNTIFLERRSSQAEKQRGVLRTQLERGQSLIVFPEGTSTDGLRVLPFKSSLFSIAEKGLPDCPLAVQPISITCTGLDGLPITRAWRPFYAWYGDMTLVSHLWNVLRIGHFTVDVIFHPAVAPETFPDRKALARYCHEQVGRGIEQSLTGRKFRLEPKKVERLAPA